MWRPQDHPACGRKQIHGIQRRKEDLATSNMSERTAELQNSSRPWISQAEVLIPDQGTREVKGFVPPAWQLSGQPDNGMQAS